MEHEPSDYEGTVTLSFYQMVEVHKALSERIATLLRRGEYQEKDIDALLAVAEILGDHEQKAVEGWERKVAEREASALNDDEAVRRFLDGQ